MESVRTKIFGLWKWFLLLGIVALFAVYWQRADGKLHLYFFDVGQGDSIFIETPEGHQVLVDGGPNGKIMSELAKAMGFDDRFIDLVVLTHPHKDHVAGLVEVLKKYSIGAVMITGVSYENGYYNEFLRLISLEQTPVIFADNKSDFALGQAKFDVIYPFEKLENQEFKNANNSSLVIKMSYGETDILFMGDAEKEVEESLLSSGVDLRAEILKVGHHGSKTSSNENFLFAVRPKIAVIQCGVDNMFGHPSQQTLDNLQNSGVENIYRNDLDGTIEISF